MPKPPICELLNLDQRKLPAEVFDRISDRAGRLKEREERARKAWESFGKPGRDPETVGSLFNLLASNGAWIPHLKMAQMRDHWDQVVGVENAKHSYPASLPRRRADDTLRQPGLDHHPVVYDAVADGHHPQETRRSDHQ